MRARTTLLDRPLDAAVFVTERGSITAAAVLADAHALADALPGGAYIVNLCRDRYAFAVTVLAGLLRGRTALLNADPAALPALEAAYPGCIVAADAPLDTPLPTVLVQPGGRGWSDANPEIPPDHLAAIVFTSGSTGAPVPHQKRWAALADRSRAAAVQFGLQGGTIVGTVPPQHMYGFETTVLLPFHAPVASWCGAAFFPADIRAALLACPGPRHPRHHPAATPHPAAGRGGDGRRAAAPRRHRQRHRTAGPRAGQRGGGALGGPGDGDLRRHGMRQHRQPPHDGRARLDALPRPHDRHRGVRQRG